MYPSQVPFRSMGKDVDGFRTAICHSQNLSLIKFSLFEYQDNHFTILLLHKTQL